MSDYKIMQFTDCHLSEDNVAEGLKEIEALFNSASPNLSVFTGDIVFSDDQLGFYDELNEFFRSRNAFFAVTLGNHEGEIGKASRAEIIEHCSGLSNCLTSFNVCGDRYGDTVIDTPFEGTSVVLMDSGDYMSKEWRRRHPLRSKYAALTEEQIAWYERSVRGKKAVYVYMHIPLTEYRRAYYSALKRDKVVYGSLSENLTPSGRRKLFSDVVCSGGINSGFFDRANALGNLKAVFVGHDHLNDFYVEYNGVALVYGQKTVGLEGAGYSFPSRGFPDYTGATLVSLDSNGGFTAVPIYYKDIT